MCTKNFKKILILMFFAPIIFGCSKQPKERIVANIGPYDLRVSDYKREASKLSYTERKSLSSLDTKYAFLDQLIDREVLLQEAQTIGLDRDPLFMQKIEDFWEEALLEELVKRKSKEIIKEIGVEAKEVKSYYDKMKTKVKARIVVVEKEEEVKTVFEDKDKIASTEKIYEAIKDTGWEWFLYEEIDPAYRDILFGMKPGDKKMVLKQNSGYFMFFVSEFSDREVAEFEEINKVLTRTIKEEKELSAIDGWISGLRTHTKISINKDVMEYIEVE